MTEQRSPITENGPEARRMAIYSSRIFLPSQISRLSPFAAEKRRLAVRNDSDSDADSFNVGKWTLNDGVPLPPANLEHINRRCFLQLSLIRPSTVLDRMRNFLRIKSIACSFHTSSSTVRVNCQTPNFLHFVVFLWQGTTDTGDSVIVETQRRQGCSIEMQYVRRALFAALQSDQEPTSTSIGICEVMIPQRLCKRVYENLCKSNVSSFEAHQQVDKAYAEEVAKCSDLLASACGDTKLLGMESLSCITDPTVTDKTRANDVARALIYDEGPQTVFRRVLFHLMNRKEDIHSYTSAAQTSRFDEMHTLALKILTNSLHVLRDHKVSREPSIDVSAGFWRSVLDSCKQDVADAACRPREATLAIDLCIGVLEIAPDAYAILAEDELLIDLVKANSFGSLHHLALEQKSSNLLDSLQ